MNAIINVLLSLYFTVYVGGATRITSLYTPGFSVGGEIALFTPDSASRYLMGVSTTFYGFKSAYYDFYRREYEINITLATANLSALTIGYSRDLVMESRRWGWELAGGLSLISYDLTFPEADVNLDGTIVPFWGQGVWVRVKFHKWERKRSSYGLWASAALYRGSFEALYPFISDTTWAGVRQEGGPITVPMFGGGVTITIRD